MLAGLVRATARRAGFELVRYEPRNFAHLRRRELLRSAGVTVLLDVGAAEGDWALTARREGYSGRIESFEPRAAAYAELDRKATGDSRWTAHHLALSDRADSAELNVSPVGMASSLHTLGVQAQLEPTHAYAGTEAVSLARLDQLGVVGEHDRAFLKADVQGHELAVLRGAEGVLGHLAGVELELSFVPLYAGQALAHELMAWLYERSFRLASIEVAWRNRATGDLLLANGIFLPSDA